MSITKDGLEIPNSHSNTVAIRPTEHGFIAVYFDELEEQFVNVEGFDRDLTEIDAPMILKLRWAGREFQAKQETEKRAVHRAFGVPREKTDKLHAVLDQPQLLALQKIQAKAAAGTASDFEQSCLRQVNEWMDADVKAYPKPLSPKQWHFVKIAGDRVAIDAETPTT